MFAVGADKQTVWGGKSHGTLFLYMITVVSLLYEQRWKDSTLSRMEEQLMKMMELTELNCYDF